MLLGSLCTIAPLLLLNTIARFLNDAGLFNLWIEAAIPLLLCKPIIDVSIWVSISTAESITLISPFYNVSENESLMFSRALKYLDFFIVLFFPGLLLYYIAIFKGDIFSHHSN